MTKLEYYNKRILTIKPKYNYKILHLSTNIHKIKRHRKKSKQELRKELKKYYGNLEKRSLED